MIEFRIRIEMKKILRMTFTIISSLILLLILITFLVLQFAPQLGKDAEGKRLERMQSSSHYKDGKFLNPLKTEMDIPPGKMVEIFWDMMVMGKKNEPDRPIENVPFDQNMFLRDPQETTISWFGHSSLLIKMNGQVMLIDPVFSDRASTFSFVGPKRFAYEHDMTVDQLPPVDAVIISHDHYDHLDYETVQKLREKVSRFYTPLGVGAHLERWGIAPENIIELDWWETIALEGNLKLTATPNRHFSGRGFSRNETLWCSYVLEGKHKLFIGADSGYYPSFKTIGEKYGPFDLTLLECGAYNKLWESIHMMPEQTAMAHQDLKGKILMPIHWGKFNLALHHWLDPMQRLEAKANALDIDVITPKPLQTFTLEGDLPRYQWWKEYAE